MKWRYYRAGLYREKKRSHWLKQWPIRKGLGDKKGELSLVEDVIWTSSKRWTGQPMESSRNLLNTKTPNQQKIVRKIQKYNNLLQAKRILKPKYMLREVRFSHLACQTGHIATLSSVSYVTRYAILYLHAVSCPYSTATRYELVA